jgi:hypothetical protein
VGFAYCDHGCIALTCPSCKRGDRSAPTRSIAEPVVTIDLNEVQDRVVQQFFQDGRREDFALKARFDNEQAHRS